MNKIIFDKHMDTNGTNLITGPLTLPDAPPPEKVPFHGMITIPAYDYAQQFSSFCFKSISNKD